MSTRLLSVGFVLVPDFTMLALAGFLDTLRLAADEGDRSRPIDCGWTLMTEDGGPVRASNGVLVEPDGALAPPESFDYVAVIGGTLHKGLRAGDRLLDWLREAAKRKVPLIGACTGSFVLAQAGLMAGRRCCVSWFHQAEFELDFPGIQVVADQLFVHDRDRITCAGGTSVIHLASHLVERHVGEGRSAKGLRVMLEERAREAGTPQPLPALPGLDRVRNPRVRRAMLLMERTLSQPTPLDQVARAVSLSTRQLHRLFVAQTGQAPSAFRERLRLGRAEAMLCDSRLPITDIALRCGFADAAHFARRFRSAHGVSPASYRRQGGAGGRGAMPG